MDKGILYLVPTPIGNLGDMTYRGVEILKNVDLIAAEDTRTSRVLLNHYGIKNKLISYHKFNENKQTAALLEMLEQGKSIALITDAGTPGISDPSSILVKAAIDKEIQVSCLPGATAIIPALAASGLNTDIFTFAGFLPAKQKDRKQLLDLLKTSPHTLVFYESTHSIADTLTELKAALGDRRCVVAKELSKIHETFYRGLLSEVCDSPAFNKRGEFVILVSGRESIELTDFQLMKLIRSNQDENLSVKELAAALSEQTGAGRNRIYELILKQNKKD
jgi:16S rRNA (cytidine1402-2'-O)-methyltransferase